MEPLICSLGECRKEIVGVGVVLGSVGDEDLDFEGAGMLEYEATKKHFALLHPTCFIDLFNEMMKAQSNVMLTVMAGGVGDIRTALAM